MFFLFIIHYFYEVKQFM